MVISNMRHNRTPVLLPQWLKQRESITVLFYFYFFVCDSLICSFVFLTSADLCFSFFTDSRQSSSSRLELTSPSCTRASAISTSWSSMWRSSLRSHSMWRASRKSFKCAHLYEDLYENDCVMSAHLREDHCIMNTRFFIFSCVCCDWMRFHFLHASN